MRQLLIDVPPWGLAAIFIGGMTIVCLGGFLLVHRLDFRSPSTGMDTMVSAFSGKATALFGILLVFVIVAEFNHFEDTKAGASREATALAQIVRDSGPFPAQVRATLRNDAGEYGSAVVYVEWPRLGAGKGQSPRAVAALAKLQDAIEAYRPSGSAAIAFYGKVADQLDTLISERRTRVDAGGSSIPNVLLWLLFGGATAFVMTMFAFSPGKDKLLIVMIVALAALTGAGLLVAVMLDYPFSGTISVHPGAYHEGVLATLVHR